MQTTTIVAPKVSANIPVSSAAIGAYTPASGAIVTMLSLANKTAGTVKVTVTVYNGATDYIVCYLTPIGPNDTLFLGGENLKITLVNGWNVRASCDTLNAVDAVMCVTEFA